MSNFSDIGFHIETEEDFKKAVEQAYEIGNPVKASNGTYVLYSDKSGAELWVQLNTKNEIIGVNPHYKGISRRKVCVTSFVDRYESELDGSFYGWADPTDENDPESGEYPFVFDIPNFRAYGKIETPKTITVQLAAFAQEITLFESEEEYDQGQTSEWKYASQSFIPSGLFTSDNDTTRPPEAYGIFTGIIKEWELKSNDLTGKTFYWLLVDTLGGEIDVVADPRCFDKNPKVNGIAQGQFWLSAIVIDPPPLKSAKKSLLGRIFGS